VRRAAAVIRRLGALMAVLLCLAAAQALAQGNPFGAGPAPAPPPADPGWLGSLQGGLATIQRDVTQAMTRQMRAVRDGGVSLALLVGMGFAFLYGAVHAAGPGHGKLVVVTYFLSHEARIGRGIAMGVKIAAAHVVGAIVLVVVADFVFRRVVGVDPGDVRWFALASYAAIALIGLGLIVQAARGGGHDHGHGAHCDHHHHDHHHGGGRESVLSVLIGFVPCTGAILIMLYALANGIVLAGVLMVAALGLGMAVSMSALGLASIAARKAVTARLDRRAAAGPWSRIARYAGPVAITAVGSLLFIATL